MATEIEELVSMSGVAPGSSGADKRALSATAGDPTHTTALGKSALSGFDISGRFRKELVMSGGKVVYKMVDTYKVLTYIRSDHVRDLDVITFQPHALLQRKRQ